MLFAHQLWIGILLLINPFESAEVFLRIIGGILAVGSILELIETIMVLRTIDDVKELPFEDKSKSQEKKSKEKWFLSFFLEVLYNYSRWSVWKE